MLITEQLKENSKIYGSSLELLSSQLLLSIGTTMNFNTFGDTTLILPITKEDVFEMLIESS